MKELFETIKRMGDSGKLKFKYLEFTLNEYRAIQAVFNQLVRHKMADCFMGNVVSFFALNGLITITSDNVNWLVKIPEGGI